jgi:hypothetical protein
LERPTLTSLEKSTLSIILMEMSATSNINREDGEAKMHSMQLDLSEM